MNMMARRTEEVWMTMMMLLILMVATTTEAKGTMDNNNNNTSNRKRGIRHSSAAAAAASGGSEMRNGTSSSSGGGGGGGVINEAYCLSWRMAVEANNMKGWRTIPSQCLRHVQGYMVGGQYSRDINLIIDQVYAYLDGVTPLATPDGFDAWIFDVDDTCLSNLYYYRARRFGCDPYNPTEFKTWALRGESPAIPGVLQVFNKVIEAGYKAIIVTGRDEELLGDATADNLLTQGFVGYERLIMRSPEHRGQSAITYKSDIRRRLAEQGYRIWGNVGDQWSDLQGNFTGDRTFKLPNPMYFVP